jgi:hypothetical protein
MINWMTVSWIHSGNSGEEINPQEIPVEFSTRHGFSVSYRGKTLLSRIDPAGQAERLAAAIPVKDRTLYLCPSPLYGYGLSLLLDKLEANSVVLCVEADEKLFEISKKALAELSLFPKDRKLKPIALVKALAPETVCAFVRETWGSRVFRRVETIHLTGGWQLSPRLYEDFAQALRWEIAVEWGNAMTLIRLGRLYARNFIRNLALLQEDGIGAIEFSSSPVLALGAGPSLDFLLKELSGFWGGKIPGPEQRRFKIVCVDTCLTALLEREILPDLVVILESQHWNLEDFTGARGRRIDAVFDLSSLPASTRVLAGKRYFFATPWTELKLFRRLTEEGFLSETIAPLGSVGLSAVALALRVTKGSVLTGGIDFAYTVDAYRARSTSGYLSLERKQNRFRSLIDAGPAFREGTFPALSKNGKNVRNDPAMRNYRELFEQEFGGNPRLLDIDGPGLPLGVKTISPVEAFTVLNRETALPPINMPAGEGLQFTERKPLDTLNEKLIAFIRREIDSLLALKEMLSGAASPEGILLEELLDSADYLWVHFPECARTGCRPPETDLSFLKRVRTEIEPFLKLWERLLESH